MNICLFSSFLFFSAMVCANQQNVNTSAPSLCSNESIPNLYKAAIESVCSINYVWRLVHSAAYDGDQLQCAGNYFSLGAAAHLVKAQVDSRFFHAEDSIDGVANDLVSNTATNRKDLVSLMQTRPQDASLKSNFSGDGLSSVEKDFQIAKNKHIQRELATLRTQLSAAIKATPEQLGRALENFPNNYMRVHYMEDSNAIIGVTKGPNKYLFQGSRAFGRLASLSMKLGLFLAVLDFTVSSTPTACAENHQQFLDVDTNNNCKPFNALGPNTFKFLNLPLEQQKKIIATNPRLCHSYGEIAVNIKNEIDKKFGVKKTLSDCDGSTLTSLVNFKNGDKSKIRLDGLSANIQTENMEYKVSYGEREGHLHVKSVVWKNRMGNTPPITYVFPKDITKVGDKNFEIIMPDLARNTMAIEANGLNKKNCGAPHKPEIEVSQ